MRKSTEIMYNKTIGNMRFLKQCTGLWIVCVQVNP